jgi:hypothetical protein
MKGEGERSSVSGKNHLYPPQKPFDKSGMAIRMTPSLCMAIFNGNKVCCVQECVALKTRIHNGK